MMGKFIRRRGVKLRAEFEVWRHENQNEGFRNPGPCRKCKSLLRDVCRFRISVASQLTESGAASLPFDFTVDCRPPSRPRPHAPGNSQGTLRYHAWLFVAFSTPHEIQPTPPPRWSAASGGLSISSPRHGGARCKPSFRHQGHVLIGSRTLMAE
jgi:hypothetical protein